MQISACCLFNFTAPAKSKLHLHLHIYAFAIIANNFLKLKIKMVKHEIRIPAEYKYLYKKAKGSVLQPIFADRQHKCKFLQKT